MIFQKFIRFGSATLPLEAMAFVRWLKNRGFFSSTTTSQFAILRSLILSHFPVFCKLYLLFILSEKYTLGIGGWAPRCGRSPRSLSSSWSWASSSLLVKIWQVRDSKWGRAEDGLAWSERSWAGAKLKKLGGEQKKDRRFSKSLIFGVCQVERMGGGGRELQSCMEVVPGFLGPCHRLLLLICPVIHIYKDLSW